MSIITDIIQGDQNKGDANLGGASAGPLNFDNSKPLAMLSDYTNLYNKAVYDQGIKDRDAKIANVADVSKIDLSVIHGKDRDEMTSDLNDFKPYARNYASTDNQSVQQELDWKSRLGALTDKYGVMKQRTLSYNQQYETIESSDDNPAQKADKHKELDDLFDNTSSTTPMTSLSGFVPQAIPIPSGNTTVTPVSIIKTDGTMNVDAEGHVFSVVQAGNRANEIANGITQNYTKPGAGASKEEINQYNRTVALGDDDKAKHASDMADVLNTALATKDSGGNFKYFDPTGKVFNESAFLNDFGTLPAGEAYQSIEGLHKYSQGMINQINNTKQLSDGRYSYALPNNIHAQDYQGGLTTITADGVTPQKMIMGAIYKSYNGDIFLKKQQDNTTNTTRRGQTLDYNLGEDKLNAEKDHWKLTAAGTPGQQNDALLKSQRIFDDMKGLSDKNGFITPDKVRQLNQEQLKYLGSSQVVKNINGTEQTVFTPLDLQKDKVEYGIQLGPDGSIKVLRPKPGETKLIRLDNGGYGGNWDNSKSSNITGMGTNIVNEEVHLSKPGDIGAYAPVDAAKSDGTPGVAGATSTIGGKSNASASGGTVAPGGYIKIRTVNGQKWGMRANGKPEKIN